MGPQGAGFGLPADFELAEVEQAGTHRALAILEGQRPRAALRGDRYWRRLI
jgi:hypothetical protein